jgi:hypothetical protein
MLSGIVVIFIFGAVVLGAGAMLSPAWPTAQPRVGLSGTLALALVIGGAVFWAMAFGWNILVVDYMLFALVTSIFLGGTLSVGQTRAEARGEVLLDEDQGWTGPEDLLFFALVGAAATLIALLIPVPPGPAAPVQGLMAISARLGGSFENLAPFLPDVTYAQPPGYTALIAYLSQQLNQPLPVIQFGVMAVLVLLSTWLIYDYGAEVRDKRLGRAMAAAYLIGAGLWTTYLRAEATSLLGLTFALAFVIYAYRYYKHQKVADLIGAGLLLGATLLINTGILAAALLAYFPWLISLYFTPAPPKPAHALVLAIGVPLIAIIATGPWLINGSPSLIPQPPLSADLTDTNTIGQFLAYHGFWIIPLALLGAVIGIRRREPVAFLAVIWLLIAADLTFFGIAARLLNFRLYDWNVLTLPLAWLGGIGLLWLWDRFAALRLPAGNRGRAIAGAGVLVGTALWALTTVPLLNIPTTQTTSSDVEAMAWIKRNTDAEVRVLNAPGSLWTPVAAERAAVYYPVPLNTTLPPSAAQTMQDFFAFWEDPASFDRERLDEAGIRYVLVPSVMDIDVPTYLDRVYEAGGARVYQVTDR